MDMYALSDIGKQRETNQDAFEIRNIGSLYFYVVADGMGGHLGGEVASSLSISSFFEYLEIYINKENFSNSNVGAALYKAVEEANYKVFLNSIENREYSNMGTTFTSICIDGQNAHICHVGDSRIYLFRSGVLLQKTNDHTYANELFLAGEITETEAEESIKKHILTRALGTEFDIEIDSYFLTLKKEDKILICSDGLSNMVKNSEIKEILERENDIKTATESLINLANFHGGNDNITAILININDDSNFIGGEN